MSYFQQKNYPGPVKNGLVQGIHKVTIVLVMYLPGANYFIIGDNPGMILLTSGLCSLIDVEITKAKSPRQNHHKDQNVVITTATTSSSNELSRG